MRRDTLAGFTHEMRERHDEAERRHRAAVGCSMCIGGGLALLFAGLMLAATRWLLTH